jgi:hypothetical protein
MLPRPMRPSVIRLLGAGRTSASPVEPLPLPTAQQGTMYGTATPAAAPFKRARLDILRALPTIIANQPSTLSLQLRLFGRFAGINQHLDPHTNIMAMVMIRPAANEVTIYNAGLIDKYAATDFQVEFALRDGCHSPTFHTAGLSRDFNTMANTGYGLVRLEKVPRDSNQIFIVSEVLRCSPSLKKDAQVFIRIYILKGCVGLNRVTLELTCDFAVPVQRNLTRPLLINRPGHFCAFLYLYLTRPASIWYNHTSAKPGKAVECPVEQRWGPEDRKMATGSNSRVLRTIPLLIAVCLVSMPTQAKYGGGSGTADDPYRITTAEQMNTIGAEPNDWGMHFKLMADIDLSGYDGKDGRPVFNIIGMGYYNIPGLPKPFTGVFDGNGHNLHNYRGSNVLFRYVVGSNAEIKNLGLIKPVVVGEDFSSSLVMGLQDGTISNCYVQDCNLSGIEVGGLVCSNNGTITDCHVSGQIIAGGHGVGGLVGYNGENGTITCCSFSGSVLGESNGSRRKGGLVGTNSGGISFCYSTGSVSGCATGGLVGENSGVIYSCYSNSDVTGGKYYGAGGLVAYNSGIVSNCYSTGAVSGTGGWLSPVGGLVGDNYYAAVVTNCFWDIQTSDRATSAGGTGKTTADMKTKSTFTDANWDFVGERVNGTEDIWWIREGQDYPRLWWEWHNPWAIYPNPWNGATDIIRRPILSWHSGPRAMWHDVYFGENEDVVGNATTANVLVYRARQPAEVTTYDPGTLEWGKTYYWRIDEVNEADPDSPWKGDVWRFTTTTDCIKSPKPPDGATEVILSPILRWVPGGPGLQYDVYFGGDEQAVANATPQTPGIYRGRQAPEMTTYEPGCLKGGKTYYWRIDGLNGGDPHSLGSTELAEVWKGDVWSFTTVDLIGVAVADDFESYTDNPTTGPLLLLAWIGGLFNGTGSMVVFAEQTIVHGGKQSMPMEYNNVREPWYSEADRTWETPQDWTTDRADTLTLYLRGGPNNGRDNLYVAIEDSAGQIAVVTHPDANAVLTTEWQEWLIPLPDLKAAGVNVAAVKKMYIGVGDRDNPQPGGTGRIYIDDIRLTRRFLLVDFDGDMDTDFLDFCIFAEHWLADDSNFWCGGGGTDLTNDGLVNYEDLMEFAGNWLGGRQ